MKKYAAGGMSADEEADLQALKTLKQGDYDVGGPKRRYARGKVKKMAGGGTPLPYAPPTVPAPVDTRPQDYDPGRKRYNEMMDRINARQEAVVNNRMKGGPRMRSGGSVGSASKRADGCAVRGKTRGKIV